MVARHDAVETMRRLIAHPPSQGFARLASMGRHDLAVDTLVLDLRWDSVFSDEERRSARRRLR